MKSITSWKYFSSLTKETKFPSVSHRKVRRFYDKVSIKKSRQFKPFYTFLADKTPMKLDKEYRNSVSHVNWNVSRSSQYYQIYLDKYPSKSIYRDEMLIPTYPLAVALAEEWAMQQSIFYNFHYYRETSFYKQQENAFEHHDG